MLELIALLNAAVTIKGAIDGEKSPDPQTAAYLEAGVIFIRYVDRRIKEAQAGGIITAAQQREMANAISDVKTRVGL